AGCIHKHAAQIKNRNRWRRLNIGHNSRSVVMKLRLEFGAKTEIDVLDFIIALFNDRLGEIDPHRPEWRLPGKTDADAQPEACIRRNRIARRNLGTQRHSSQRAGTDEETPLKAEFGWQRGRRYDFDRAPREAIAAERILIAVGQIARADTGILKAA